MDRLEIATNCYHRYIRGNTILLLFFLTVICNVFSACSAYATDSITLNIDTNNLAVNLMPLSPSGDFAKSNDMNISVSTTSTSGYTLGIASSTGSTDLTNQSDNTAKITSVSSPISESDFSNSSNTQYNNKWGYKPSQYAILDSEGHPTIYPNTNFRPLPGTNGEIIAKTECANGTAPCTNPTDTYTLSIGARANNQTATGKYVSDTFVITAVANTNVVRCDSSKLCVEYDGNGLSYPETSTQLPRTVNNVNYNSSISSTPTTKYAHTPNIDDSGTASGTYPTGSVGLREIVTIPGASSITVTISYSIEENWDYLYVFAGEYTGPITGAQNTPMDAGQDYTLTGGDSTTSGSNTTTFTITGDTVTFAFWSDANTAYYGYYATITGYGYERTVSSGEYTAPTGTNPVFLGWSTSQTTPGSGFPSDVEYANESEVLAIMPGDEGETKTLYAVWQQPQTITFIMDNKVTSIAILNSDGTTVGTITSSGQSLVLAQGNTYTIKPTHVTIYITDAITKTSGAGVLNGEQFTVGAGAATISVTSKSLSPIQNFNCSSLAQGDTERVYDTRDNEIYLIGKLADGKCWMLDNLRLDITNSTILNGLTTSNTHVDSTSLTSLKSGNRSAGTQYASSGFVTWNASNPDNVYNQAKANADDKDTTTTCYGEGSGKIGVYYNYCAASAGSYCYNNRAGTGNASYDLCPAGWRMPTGGTSGEYETLNAAYDNNKSFMTALSTPASGYFKSGSASGQGGSYGYFWASTYHDSDGMYRYYVEYEKLRKKPSAYVVRYEGQSLRCVKE